MAGTCRASRISHTSHGHGLLAGLPAFDRPELLAEALRHPGAARNSRSAMRAFQRLEFLGDRILGLIIAETLYRTFPHENEGELARRHTVLVQTPTLAGIARAIGLEHHLVHACDPDTALPDSVLADAIEAVLAALWLDQGPEATRTFILEHWPIQQMGTQPPAKDAKSALQEHTLASGLGLPTYQLVERTGKDHSPRFLVAVRLSDGQEAHGEGSSRQQAEMAAARALLDLQS